MELKKRARRRLVGAAALALLAAIVLPMVMDHEPRQAVQDVQVKIPSRDAGGFASRILPNKPAVTPLPPAEGDARTEAESEAKEPAAPKEEPKAPEAAKPAGKTIEKPIEKPAEKAAANKAEEARALAALSGGATGSEQWVVNLGTYKETGNVKVLIAKLKQMGVPAYTENSDTPQGARTRVRAGPFKSREAAEQAKAKIRTIRVDGTVAQK